MRFSRARTEEVLRALVHEIRAERLTFMAGSIAYHAFLSILPLLLLVLTFVQRTENVALSTSIVGIMEAVLTAQASGIIQQGLTEADASVSVLGVGFLLWGSLRIFRGLDTAFSDIYETGASNTFLDQLGDGLLLLVTVAVAILSASALGSILPEAGSGLTWAVVGGLVRAAGLFVVFYPMYYVFPDTDVSPLEIVPGVAFAAVGLTIAQVLFTAFKSGSTGGNIIASILVLLSWLYIIGLLILLGAAINAVLSNRSEDVDINPVVGDHSQQNSARETTMSREALLAELDALADRFQQTQGTVTVEVADERTELDCPETATVDRSSDVFGLDQSVALALRWWPKEK
ncbi:membrane protein [Haloarcula vallismortis]|uniref:Ribonuclease BN-like protein n=2 Tax=Haloarcula vallismortis TaxID=28442 RepID=M0JPK5_HALVA|nr:YihY/virulence factor BrkB family protein [Haloarcula vallismortis]EMA10313.1 ribonuclease BN-like protein [Haloarcula vallismortis ATCC 29715]SDW89694.1 membrane protein [Haloarcula vallismortis]